jgi:hypothetical protein
MLAKVFVSYSRKDIAVVKAISDFIGNVELVFRDEDDIIAGDDFADEIKRQINRSRIVVVFWSVHSSTSIWVKRETQEAIKFKRPILPVLLDKTPLDAQLAPLNAVDLSTWNGDFETDQVQKLVRDIRLKSSYAPSTWWPTPLDGLGLAAILILAVVVASILFFEDRQTEDTAAPIASSSQSSTVSAPSTSSTITLGDASSAELGVDYLLGLGTEVDVEKGLQILDKALLPPGDFHSTLSHLEKGMREFNRSDFTEIIKSVDLLASKNSVAGTFVEGVFAANGFTHPACATNCFDVARQQALKLKVIGRSDLSGLVEKTITENFTPNENLIPKINFAERDSLLENTLLRERENKSIFINTRKISPLRGLGLPNSPPNRAFRREVKPRVIELP